VTGAGSGLGFELTRMHLEAGNQVFALERDISEKLRELAGKFQGTLLIVQCDIGFTESVQAAMGDVASHTGHLDVLHNNAGIHRFEDWVTLDDTDLDFCKVMYDINAVGPLRIVKAALPLLVEGSLIMNTSSEAGSLANQQEIIGYAYAMSKAGMNMGARIMDNWLRGRGIRTLMVHPGRMRTAMEGTHSNIDPWETAEKLLEIVESIQELPADMLFMDYLGNRFAW